jgi:hypothetical protein
LALEVEPALVMEALERQPELVEAEEYYPMARLHTLFEVVEEALELYFAEVEVVEVG